MHKKLHARPKSQYKIWKEFESDLSLLFQNCHTFNHDAPHGMYYMSMSAALKAYAKKELGAAKARFSELVQETDNANMKKRKAAPSSTGSSARSANVYPLSLAVSASVWAMLIATLMQISPRRCFHA
eukprot:SAG31_NODE_35_length_31836_cov_10.841352_21_plen_127_part_00